MATVNVPTKEEELTMLLDVADRLGSFSYLSRWIRETVPFLRQSLLSDMVPEPAATVYHHAVQARMDAIAEAKSILAQAREEADQIKKSALNQASTTIRQAELKADSVKRDAIKALQRSAGELSY